MDRATLVLLTCIVFVYAVCGWLLMQDVKWAFVRVTARYDNLCFRTGPTGGKDGSCIGYWEKDGKFVDLTER
jgi:hypothetical protein